jgi:hypothetical protein
MAMSRNGGRASISGSGLEAGRERDGACAQPAAASARDDAMKERRDQERTRHSIALDQPPQTGVLRAFARDMAISRLYSKAMQQGKKIPGLGIFSGTPNVLL